MSNRSLTKKYAKRGSKEELDCKWENDEMSIVSSSPFLYIYNNETFSPAVIICQIYPSFLLQIQQSRIITGDPERAERLRRPTGAHRWKHDDRHLCRTHKVPSGPQTRTQNSEKREEEHRGGGRWREVEGCRERREERRNREVWHVANCSGTLSQHLKAGVWDFCLAFLAVRVITKTLSTHADVTSSTVA